MLEVTKIEIIINFFKFYNLKTFKLSLKNPKQK